ncbi:MAG: right-handed parallel beta-helix repeat-containing protein, partial [Candidatus Micrarchaeota archaeon]
MTDEPESIHSAIPAFRHGEPCDVPASCQNKMCKAPAIPVSPNPHEPCQESRVAPPIHFLYVLAALSLFLSPLAFALDPGACNQNLATANGLYTMTADQSATGTTCFNITAQNITLDCAGYTITGNNVSGTSGVRSTQTNTTVKNCIIQDFRFGVYLNGATNGTVQNNTIRVLKGGGLFADGMVLDSSASLNLITNNSIIANHISIWAGGGANNNLITNNTIQSYGGENGDSVSIWLAGSFNDNITNNVLYNNGTSGSYVVEVSDNTNQSYFYNNTVIENSTAGTMHGFYFKSGSNHTVDCAGASITGLNKTSTYGIYSNRPNTTVKNCNIKWFERGIEISGSGSNANITNNTITTSTSFTTYGIAVETPSNAHITSNTISSVNSIYLSNSVSATVVGNTISTTYRGISTAGASGSALFANNTVSATGSAYAITVGGGGAGSNNINITNNTLTAASGYGINVVGTAANTSIDCQGAAITGSNTSDSYGIYSNQLNTTVKNCVISNFDAGIAAGNSQFSNLINNTVSSPVIGTLGYGISFGTNSMAVNNTVSAASRGYSISVGSNSTVDCGGFTTIGNNASSTYGVYSTQTNTTVKNCNISNFSSGIYLAAGANYTNATNNTINLSFSGGNAITIAANANNSAITLNNLTASIWINDSGTSNTFNTSTQGNIYYFPNGTASWNVFPIYDSSGDNWGDSGTARPFNATTVGGNFSGTGNPQDWFPYAPQNRNCSILSTAGQTYTLGYNLSINGATCFNITAQNITLDCAGYSITGNNSTSTYGV